MATADTGGFTWLHFAVDHTKTNSTWQYTIQMSSDFRGDSSSFLCAVNFKKLDRSNSGTVLLTGSLSWLYPLYEFQNGWYICSQISILNMCNHLEEICPCVPDGIVGPMVPISSGYMGWFRVKSSEKMGIHHTGNSPVGPPSIGVDCEDLGENR